MSPDERRIRVTPELRRLTADATSPDLPDAHRREALLELAGYVAGAIEVVDEDYSGGAR